MQQRLLVGKREACELLGGISPRTLDYMIASGELRVVRLGRRVMFAVKALEQFARKDHQVRRLTTGVTDSISHEGPQMTKQEQKGNNDANQSPELLLEQ